MINWYRGIGGAGFHDKLFLAPIFGVFAKARIMKNWRRILNNGRRK